MNNSINNKICRSPHETCPIIQMINIFPKYQSTFLIRNDFKHRQAVNRIYIQMQSAGLFCRRQRIIRKGKLKKNYKSKRHYKVHIEGVHFSQVRYIVIGYSTVIPIAIFIVVCENIHYHMN